MHTPCQRSSVAAASRLGCPADVHEAPGRQNHGMPSSIIVQPASHHWGVQRLAHLSEGICRSSTARGLWAAAPLVRAL